MNAINCNNDVKEDLFWAEKYEIWACGVLATGQAVGTVKREESGQE